MPVCVGYGYEKSGGVRRKNKAAEPKHSFSRRHTHLSIPAVTNQSRAPRHSIVTPTHPLITHQSTAPHPGSSGRPPPSPAPAPGGTPPPGPRRPAARPPRSGPCTVFFVGLLVCLFFFGGGEGGRFASPYHTIPYHTMPCWCCPATQQRTDARTHAPAAHSFPGSR